MDRCPRTRQYGPSTRAVCTVAPLHTTRAYGAALTGRIYARQKRRPWTQPVNTRCPNFPTRVSVDARVRGPCRQPVKRPVNTGNVDNEPMSTGRVGPKQCFFSTQAVSVGRVFMDASPWTRAVKTRGVRNDGSCDFFAVVMCIGLLR